MGQSALGPLGGAFLRDAMKASNDSSSRVCPPGDGPRSVARLGVSGVVARMSNSARARVGPWVGASRDVTFAGVPVSLRFAGAVDGAAPA